MEALVKIGSTSVITALTNAFPHSDALVSGRAALARGTRGEADVIPALVTLVVEGRRDDVEAADVLATPTARPSPDSVMRLSAAAGPPSSGWAT
jgi:hypothetical protein